MRLYTLQPSVVDFYVNLPLPYSLCLTNTFFQHVAGRHLAGLHLITRTTTDRKIMRGYMYEVVLDQGQVVVVLVVEGVVKIYK